MRLVVRHTASDERAVPLHELPRIGLPELERLGRLHVEVGVDESGRCAAPGRGGDLADDERPTAALLELCGAAGAANALCDPLGGAADIAGPFRVGAHGGDRDELRELGDQGVVGRNHAGDCRDGRRAAP